MFGLVDYSSDDNENENENEDNRKSMSGEGKMSSSIPQSNSSNDKCSHLHVQHVTTNHKDQVHVETSGHGFDNSNGIGILDTKRIANQQTVERMKHYLQLKSQGFNLTDSIRTKKDFGNPYILQKVIDYYHIDEVVRSLPSSFHFSLMTDGLELSKASLGSIFV
jgi:hypothetical protein